MLVRLIDVATNKSSGQQRLNNVEQSHLLHWAVASWYYKKMSSSLERPVKVFFQCPLTDKRGEVDVATLDGEVDVVVGVRVEVQDVVAHNCFRLRLQPASPG